MRVRSAAFGLTLVEGCFGLALIFWLFVVVHSFIKISTWVGGIGFLILYLLNDYFLVDRGLGIAFEKEFVNFIKGKKIALYIIAFSIVLSSALALYFSVTSYRETFHLYRN